MNAGLLLLHCRKQVSGLVCKRLAQAVTVADKRVDKKADCGDNIPNELRRVLN
jgi:hypothetical protein